MRRGRGRVEAPASGSRSSPRSRRRTRAGRRRPRSPAAARPSASCSPSTGDSSRPGGREARLPRGGGAAYAGRMFRFVRDPRTWRSLLFLASAIPLGTAAFALLLIGWLTTGLLAITPLVVPALIGFAWALPLLARAEARLARELVGARRAEASEPARGRGFWRSGLVVLSDRRFWMQQAYLLLRVVVGWPLGVFMLSLLAAALENIAAPVYYRWIPQDTGRNGLNYVIWRADTLPKALALVPLGIVVLLIGLALARPLGALWQRLADALLVGEPGAPLAAAGSRALAWHAGVSAGIGGLLCLIWALTTRAYFWPIWVLMPLATVLGVHAWVQLLSDRPAIWRRRRMTHALAIHLG